jgi:glucose/mannose-6-phosphate isomerase
VVVGISTSGQTRETLSAMEQAARRGARVLGIGGADSPGDGLAGLIERTGAGWHLATADPHRLARVSLWSLLTPLLMVADRLGVVRAPAMALERLADRLDEQALAYGPVVATLENPAKEAALSICETLPVVIGTTPLTGAVAQRMAGQLGANAKIPAFAAQAPEALSTYGALLDGPYARPMDLFHDPFEDPATVARLAFVLLSGGSGNPISDAQAAALESVAESRGVTVRKMHSAAADDLTVMADLISLADFTSVYVALARAQDPWASPAVHEMRSRVADSL